MSTRSPVDLTLSDDDLIELAVSPLRNWRVRKTNEQPSSHLNRSTVPQSQSQSRSQKNLRTGRGETFTASQKQSRTHSNPPPRPTAQPIPSIRPPQQSLSSHRQLLNGRARVDDDDDAYDFDDDTEDSGDSEDPLAYDVKDDNESFAASNILPPEWGARKHRVSPVKYAYPEGPAKTTSSSDDSVYGETSRTSEGMTAPDAFRKESTQVIGRNKLSERQKKQLRRQQRMAEERRTAQDLEGHMPERQQKAKLRVEALELVKMPHANNTKSSSTQWPGSMGASIRPVPTELQGHVCPPQEHATTHQQSITTPSVGNTSQPYPGPATVLLDKQSSSTSISRPNDSISQRPLQFSKTIPQASLQPSDRSQTEQQYVTRPSVIPQVNQGIKRSADGRAKARPSFPLPEQYNRRFDIEGQANAARLSRLGLSRVDAANSTTPIIQPVSRDDLLRRERSTQLPPTADLAIVLSSTRGRILVEDNQVAKSPPFIVPSRQATTSAQSQSLAPTINDASLQLPATSHSVRDATDKFPATMSSAKQRTSFPFERASVISTSSPAIVPPSKPLSSYPAPTMTARTASSEAVETSTPSARLPAFNLILTPRNGHMRDPSKDMRLAELVNTFGSPYNTPTPGTVAPHEEDELVDLLKDYIGLTWEALAMYFPHRSTWHPLQKRYSDRTIKRRGLFPNPSSKALMPARIAHSQPYSQKVREASATVTEDAFMSEVALGGVPRRSRRAAVEAKKLGAYTINRKSFGDLGEHDDDDQAEGVIPLHEVTATTSSMHHKHHNFIIPVTHMDDAKRLIDHEKRLVESERDMAATSSMLHKISRPPWSEMRAFPRQLRLHKRPSIDIKRPYLSYFERQHLKTMVDAWATMAVEDWAGKTLHTDFTDAEVAIMEPYICQVILGTVLERDKPLRPFVEELMAGATNIQIKDISRRVQSCGEYINRTKISIESYLNDLANHLVLDIPSIRKIGVRATGSKISESLRSRELGLSRTAHTRVKQSVLHNTFGPSLMFKKASSDVTNVSWSPNGHYFAIGATALMDSHSMQYNRRNNLLLGDYTNKRLLELPNHCIKRQSPISAANASHAMHQSQDPVLYTTISAVKFSPDSEVLLTAGYDNVARVWDVNHGPDVPSPRLQLKHKAPLDLLEVNDSGLFATGSKRSTESIKILRYGKDIDSQDLRVMQLASPKALERPELDITPSVIRWGPRAQSQDKYLVAGFTSASKDFGGEGETCVWDLEAQVPLLAQRGGKSVFDIAWSPSTFGRLAVASSPSGSVNRGTNSVVRIFDSFRSPISRFSINGQYAYELECPAIDVNDVIFNARDSNLVTVGCTDGRVYIWDLRNPDQILHSFAHGKSLVELDQAQVTEAIDTGVRFVQWGDTERNLFSGSSDGVVALWNPYVSPEDAYVRKVVQLGSSVMSGAFSPDFSNLLLGEEDGTVTMLSVGCEGERLQDCGLFEFKAATHDAFRQLHDDLNIEVPDEEELATEGRRAAKVKIDNDEVKWQPLAGFARGQVVQGTNYDGPYDTSSEAPSLRAKARLFQEKLRYSGKECHITHELPPLTEEEMGDSGAWRARIPEVLSCPDMQNPRARTLAAGTPVKAPAESVRPAALMCFRCNASSLRPSSFGRTASKSDILRCHDCRMAWRVDVLGYTRVDYYTKQPVKQLDVDGLEILAASMTLNMEDDEEVAQNVQAWTHNFWGVDV